MDCDQGVAPNELRHITCLKQNLRTLPAPPSLWLGLLSAIPRHRKTHVDNAESILKFESGRTCDPERCWRRDAAT